MDPNCWIRESYVLREPRRETFVFKPTENVVVEYGLSEVNVGFFLYFFFPYLMLPPRLAQVRRTSEAYSLALTSPTR